MKCPKCGRWLGSTIGTESAFAEATSTYIICPFCGYSFYYYVLEED